MFKFNLKPNEKLLKVYRQTELMLIKPVLIIFALIYVPWAFLIKYDLHTQFRRILLFWTILVLLYGLNKYVLWLLNSYVITSQRLVVIIYHNLFQKQVVESPVERILNISFKQKGVSQSLLGYGDVVVQIVGLVDPLIFRHVRNPNKVKDQLWQVHNKVAKTVKPKFDKENLPEIQQQIGYHAKKKNGPQA